MGHLQTFQKNLKRQIFELIPLKASAKRATTDSLGKYIDDMRNNDKIIKAERIKPITDKIRERKREGFPRKNNIYCSNLVRDVSLTTKEKLLKLYLGFGFKDINYTQINETVNQEKPKTDNFCVLLI